MTGWRLGYIAGPKHFVSACNKIQSQVAFYVLNNYIDLNECGLSSSELLFKVKRSGN